MREGLAPGNSRSVATIILLDKPTVATAITECSRVRWIRNERLVLRYRKLLEYH
jgi:hypothetical protein